MIGDADPERPLYEPLIRYWVVPAAGGADAVPGTFAEKYESDVIRVVITAGFVGRVEKMFVLDSRVICSLNVDAVLLFSRLPSPVLVVTSSGRYSANW